MGLHVSPQTHVLIGYSIFAVMPGPLLRWEPAVIRMRGLDFNRMFTQIQQVREKSLKFLFELYRVFGRKLYMWDFLAYIGTRYAFF
jgi:hypothetical protein